MTTRLLGRILTLVVLATSGGYLLVYLYRWEWNRAIISGLFFVAAELALIGTVVIRRLVSIERRLDARDGARIDAAGIDPAVLTRIEEAAPPPATRFDWLDPSQPRTNVFVPVLLGAGVILSLAAQLIERVAGATTTPAFERGLARRLRALALPEGGFVRPAPVVHPPIAAPRFRRPEHLLSRGVGTLMTAFLLAGAVDALADATQNRPDVYPTDRATTVQLYLESRRPGVDTLRLAETLWVVCQHTVPTRIHAVSVDATASGHATLVLNPALGRHSIRRFRGCLSDFTVDRVLGQVVAVTEGPYPVDR